MSHNVKVRLFSNGTEYDMWNVDNCEQCARSCNNNGQGLDEMPNCLIELAIMFAAIGDGKVTAEVRAQAGMGAGMSGQCGEFEGKQLVKVIE